MMFRGRRFDQVVLQVNGKACQDRTLHDQHAAFDLGLCTGQIDGKAG